MVKKMDTFYPAAGTMRKLHIYLPEDYETSGKSYPVMYFFDGHNLFFDKDATFGKSWGLKDYLDGLRADLIVVGAECAHDTVESVPTAHGEIRGLDRRMYEYLPVLFDPAKSNVFLGIGDDEEGDEGETIEGFCGIGDETMRWLVEDVKPLIDRTFRTLPDREHTGIGGSSMGGLMSVYAIFQYNSVYSRALCFSPATPFCMDALREVMANASFDPKTRVFLTWGTLEAVGCEDPTKEDFTSHLSRSSREIAERVLANGGAAGVYCQIGGEHREKDWEVQLPFAMPFLWPEVIPSSLHFSEEKDKIVYGDTNGEVLAFVEFPYFAEGKVEVTHTIVDKVLQGRGIAGILMKKMAERLRRDGAKAELTCSYAVRWFAKHPEYEDVLLTTGEESKDAVPEACSLPKHKPLN